MSYVELILAEEAAPACVRELGVHGSFQFTDLNSDLTAFQKRYVSFIKRCDEIERKIRYLNTEAQKIGVEVPTSESFDDFVNSSGGHQDANYGSYVLESLEARLDGAEKQMVDLNKFNDRLSSEYQQKQEYFHLLVKADRFLRGNGHSNLAGAQSSADRAISASTVRDAEEGLGLTMSPLTTGVGGTSSEMTFSNIAGVLPSAEKQRFERMILRITRGNCFFRFSKLSEMATDATGKHIDKICFIIFYKSESIEGKIKRICDGFGASRYDLSFLYDSAEFKSKRASVERELIEAKDVIDRNGNSRREICSSIAQDLEQSLLLVKREKSIYHALNHFKADVAGNLLRCQAWVLTDKLSSARSSINLAHKNLNLPNTSVLEILPQKKWPTCPTHFETNKYTVAFQEFVNTYGVPRYREANPALFTAATFPFFFGVMYGDVGHGTFLLLAGLFLVFTAHLVKKNYPDMLKSIYMARYMITLMGAMALYSGLIYNDYFSLALNLFGTRYVFTKEEDAAPATSISYYGDASVVYPFGVDPVWHLSNNNLLFQNSMKMKMSVILGIIHMVLGILLRGCNSLYFNSKLDFFSEFVPMILFALSFFGYMVVLIFMKWSINWNQRMALGTCGYDADGVFGGCQLSLTNTQCYNAVGTACTALSPLADVCVLDYGGTGDGCQPPNLITTLINIALKPGVVDEPLYPGQSGVQSWILMIAFICVPWLLCGKPLYIKFSTPKPDAVDHAPVSSPHHEDASKLLGEESNSNSAAAAPHGKVEAHDDGHAAGGHSHDFGEICIHQAIETIEFVLGMVSNTASYLRLWALSLAHSELASVFWHKAMLPAIETGNPIYIFIGYAIFACVTFVVLLAMDVLECFLHALRLHWVEFQNKFFKADGFKFVPYNFKLILESASLDNNGSQN